MQENKRGSQSDEVAGTRRAFESFAVEIQKSGSNNVNKAGSNQSAGSGADPRERRGTWPEQSSADASRAERKRSTDTDASRSRRPTVVSFMGAIDELAQGHTATEVAIGTRALAEVGIHKAERKPGDGLTFNEAVQAMIINCVGAGCVLFPKILADVGMFVGPLLCIICAFVCHQCGVMICTACRIAEDGLGEPIHTYEALADFACPKLKIPLLITKNFAMLGFIIAYFQLVVDSIATFFPGNTPDCKPNALIRFGIVMPIFCVLAMITSLKQLARFSALGILAVTIECCCIIYGGIYIMIEKEKHWVAPHYDSLPKLPNKTDPTAVEDAVFIMGNVGKYMAVFLFSFAVLATVPSMRSQLAEPAGMHKVLTRSFCILIAINCVVMITGYLGFGEMSPDNVIAGDLGHPGISAELPTIGYVASASIIVNILTSSPLYVFVIITVFESSGDGAIFQPLSVPNMGLRIALICTLAFIGWMLPYVGEVISLVSSLFAVCNNIFYPAIFHWFARKRMSIPAKNAFTRQFKYWFSVIVGMLVMGFGFKGALETLLFKLNEAKHHGPTVCSNQVVE